jgi:hypothetical protein
VGEWGAHVAVCGEVWRGMVVWCWVSTVVVSCGAVSGAMLSRSGAAQGALHQQQLYQVQAGSLGVAVLPDPLLLPLLLVVAAHVACRALAPHVLPRGTRPQLPHSLSNACVHCLCANCCCCLKAPRLPKLLVSSCCPKPAATAVLLLLLHRAQRSMYVAAANVATPSQLTQCGPGTDAEASDVSIAAHQQPVSHLGVCPLSVGVYSQ